MDQESQESRVAGSSSRHMTALSLTSLPHHVLSLLIQTYFTAAFTVDLVDCLFSDAPEPQTVMSPTVMLSRSPLRLALYGTSVTRTADSTRYIGPAEIGTGTQMLYYNSLS